MPFIITKKNTHNTMICTWKPKREKNQKMFFLYHVNITFKGNTNFQNSPTLTGRRHKPEGSSNSLIYQHQLEGGTNLPDLPTPTGRKHPLCRE
jgi:hypothetical protein